MKKNHQGIIKENIKIAKDTFKLTFDSNIKEVKAGQFVSILIPDKTLRRPFSVSDFVEDKISIIYKLKGDGTKYISSLKEGEKIDFIGPMGNSFNIENKKRALIVGAGVGIAPMLYLKKVLNKNNIENFLISGFKEEKEIIKGSDKYVIGGSVLDSIEGLIDEYKPDVIYSCGPYIVLKLLSHIAKEKGIETQVAMEKLMACSIGVCRGCVIELKRGNETLNASVCKDGPVFKGSEIVWQI